MGLNFGNPSRRAEMLAADDDGPVGDHSAQVQPPGRSNTGPMTLDRAMTLTSVFRSIQILSGIGSDVEIDSWRNGFVVNPAPALVRQPDPWRSRESFVERCIINLATEGNNFLLKSPVADSFAVEALNPWRTWVRWTKGINGRRRTKNYEHLDDDGRSHTYASDRIEHIWNMELPGHDRGVGPIAWHRAVLQGALDLREYADNWFREQDVPSGTLTTDQQLNAEQAKAYKRRWMGLDDEDDETRRLGPQVRILGQGLHYAPIMLNPADAQWLESQNASVLDVARMFGLTADYLLAVMEKSSLTYTTLEMSDSRVVRTTLSPVYLRKIAAGLTNCLPRGQVARFRIGDLIQPDAKTQAEVDQIYINAGVVGRDEVRVARGWPGPAPAMPAPVPAPTPEGN